MNWCSAIALGALSRMWFGEHSKYVHLTVLYIFQINFWILQEQFVFFLLGLWNSISLRFEIRDKCFDY